MNRLYYFTIEDESMLAEAFSDLDDAVFAITYKVAGTDDVFVTTGETREALDRHDVSYNLLAEEEADRIAVYHTPLSREELADHEDVIKALALAYRAIATPTSPPRRDTPSSGGCSTARKRRATSWAS
jgi:hypothetical protein